MGGGAGFVLGLAVLVVLAIVFGKQDAVPHDQKVREWSSTFRCNRCGTVFAVIENNQQQLPSVAASHDKSLATRNTPRRASLLPGPTHRRARICRKSTPRVAPPSDIAIAPYSSSTTMSNVQVR